MSKKSVQITRTEAEILCGALAACIRQTASTLLVSSYKLGGKVPAFKTTTEAIRFWRDNRASFVAGSLEPMRSNGAAARRKRELDKCAVMIERVLAAFA